MSTDAATAAEKQGSRRGWLNRATVTGALFVICGLLVLANDEPDLEHATNIYGIAVLGTGVVRLGYRLRSRTGSRKSLFVSLTLVALGIALLQANPTSVRTLAYIGAAGLAIQGLRLLWEALTSRRSGSPPPEEFAAALQEESAEKARRILKPGTPTAALVEGSFWLVAAAAVAIVPTAILDLLLVVAAFVLLGVGLILISFGVGVETRAAARHVNTTNIVKIVQEWFVRRDIGTERRRSVGSNLFYEEPDASGKRISFAVMMALSTLIATFGVIQDSTAVVIGAMLVAPLMTPILGVAAAIVGAWPKRAVASVLTVLAGSAGAIGVAFVASSWLPSAVTLATNSQITSRTSPTLLDLAIAVAAGAAGAYATVDPRVSSSLSGVAIAVALVPPLAVVGVTLQVGSYEDALGAFLLYATNAVSIVLSGAVVFLLTGFSSASRLARYQDSLRTSLVSVVTFSLVIVIPLALTGEALVASTIKTTRVETAIAEWLPDEDGWTLLSSDVSDDLVTVTVVGPTTIPSVESLRAELRDRISSDVRVVVNFIESQQFIAP